MNTDATHATPTPEAQLQGRLALWLEQHAPSGAALSSEQLLAYLDGGLSEQERSQVRSVLASDPALLEQFMALAPQWLATEDDAANEQTVRPAPAKPGAAVSWWHKARHAWLSGGFAGGLVAAGMAWLLIAPLSVNHQILQGLDHLPPGTQAWEIGGQGRKALAAERQPDAESAALRDGLLDILTQAGLADSDAARRLRGAPVSCEGDQRCQQRQASAKTLGHWVGLTQLYCGQWDRIPGDTWQRHLGLAAELTEEIAPLAAKALYTPATHLLSQVQGALAEAPQTNLHPICAATQDFVELVY